MIHHSESSLFQPRIDSDRAPPLTFRCHRLSHTPQRPRSLQPPLEVPKPWLPGGKCRAVPPGTETQKHRARRTPATRPLQTPRRSLHPAAPVVARVPPGRGDRARHQPTANARPRPLCVTQKAPVWRFPDPFQAAGTRCSQEAFRPRSCPNVAVPFGALPESVKMEPPPLRRQPSLSRAARPIPGYFSPRNGKWPRFAALSGSASLPVYCSRADTPLFVRPPRERVLPLQPATRRSEHVVHWYGERRSSAAKAFYAREGQR